MTIYTRFLETKGYTPDLKACIEETVNHLLNDDRKTDSNHPGMLLGKIQSGKTRSFIGVIALAFDKGYHTCVILTKGTKALAEQTEKRLQDEFEEFIEADKVKVYDIMKLPPNLTPYLRKQKLIIVVKKETNNLDRLVNFFEAYPDLTDKKTLFIDDEADFASIGFRRDRAQADGISMSVISNKINNIRSDFSRNCDFLQVTATPYSLYLQPDGEINLNSESFEPLKPTFTVLVPVHEKYTGGKQYFEDSTDPESIYSHLYIQVPDTEVETLNRRDERILNNVLKTPRLRVFRQSVLNYLTGGAIRILQNKLQDKNYKSSFIVHIATAKEKHNWQVDLVHKLCECLKEIADTQEFATMLRASYENISPSVRKNNDTLPTFEDVLSKVQEALKDGYVGIVTVNSENEIAGLLDRKGQLRLDNPFNIFVGGSILDRGLTIENLIGFFYGREPKNFQQDAVLQHSRMYGARSPEDMAVTRFYTTERIYGALVRIHHFDTLLREAFENGVHSNGSGSVIFIEKDRNGEIRPCAPNKIFISSTETIKPYKRFLPVGFQTGSRTRIAPVITEIDNKLSQLSSGNLYEPFMLDYNDFSEIIDLTASTYEYKETGLNTDMAWDTGVFKSIVRRVLSEVNNPGLKDKIHCVVKTDREISRFKNNGTAFSDAPDSAKTDLAEAKQLANDVPCLMMIKQRGFESQGWRDAEFWWPVLVTPGNCRSAIFATETIS